MTGVVAGTGGLVGITGPETAERYQELAAAVDEHCPVLDLFRNPVPVERTITTR